MIGDKHLSELCRGADVSPIYACLKELVPSDDSEAANGTDVIARAPYLHGVWGYRDADGRTAFHWAVALKNFDLAWTLMNEPYCAPVLTVDEDMSTPLATACTVAAPDDFLEAVLAKSIAAYDGFCQWRATLPNVAAAAAAAAAAGAAGASPGVAPEETASDTSAPTTTNALAGGVPAPVRSDAETRQLVVNLADEQGNTPLVLAVSRGHLRVMRWLLKQGADLTHQNSRGQSILHRAVSRGNMELVEEVVRASEKQCAGNKVLHRRWMDLQDSRGDTALFYASMENNEDVGKFLLRHGADREKLNMNGKHFWEV